MRTASVQHNITLADLTPEEGEDVARFWRVVQACGLAQAPLARSAGSWRCAVAHRNVQNIIFMPEVCLHTLVVCYPPPPPVKSCSVPTLLLLSGQFSFRPLLAAAEGAAPPRRTSSSGPGASTPGWGRRASTCLAGSGHASPSPAPRVRPCVPTVGAVPPLPLPSSHLQFSLIFHLPFIVSICFIFGLFPQLFHTLQIETP